MQCCLARCIHPSSCQLYSLELTQYLLNNLSSAAASAAAQKTTTKVGDKVAVALNNNDAIFAEIRDLSIERLGGYLQDKAIHIRER